MINSKVTNSKVFRDIYTSILSSSIELQANDGHMPAGHNGPYRDPETPVRNTSHYLISFIRAWELTLDERFKAAANKCLGWLLGEGSYRRDYTFHCRTKQGKDQCNGLMGQAWVIEALLFASEKLGSKQARDLAREIFLCHPFDESTGLWSRIEPDGRVLGVDVTFNHQLWFAASAAPLASDIDEVQSCLELFFEKSRSFWKLASNGRIIHPLILPENRLKEYIKRNVKLKYRRTMVVKEVGYHAFNLLALAMIRESGFVLPDHVLAKVERAVQYLFTLEFTQLIEITPFGFDYNPPGWEVPVAMMLLGQKEIDSSIPWLERQFEHSFELPEAFVRGGICDPATHRARIYEIARVPNQVFDLVLKI